MAGAPAKDIKEDELTEGLEKKKLSGKKIIMIAAPVLLLLIGAGAYFMLSGGDEKSAEAEHGAATEEHGAAAEGAGEGGGGEHGEGAEATGPQFVDMPQMLVNLNSESRAPTYLKVVVQLEVADGATKTKIEALMPRIVDSFQIYLRELRLEDLNGSAGMFRLKEELLMRVNASIAPAQVKDVLFKEMVVQGS